VPASGEQSKIPEGWLKYEITRLQHGTMDDLLRSQGEGWKDVVVKALFVDTQRFLGGVFPNVQVATL
jgi:hypothetical protein